MSGRRYYFGPRSGDPRTREGGAPKASKFCPDCGAQTALAKLSDGTWSCVKCHSSGVTMPNGTLAVTRRHKTMPVSPHRQHDVKTTFTRRRDRRAAAKRERSKK